MSTQEIAQKLAEICRTGDFEKAQRELYADDVVSIEPKEMDGFEKETHGLEAVYEKGRKYMSMVEATYSVKVSEPLIAGNSFAFVMEMDTKMKGQERMTMPELCVYEVKDGKVVKESFFF